MAHPGFAAEDAIVTSPEWGRALEGRRLGSFADLDASPQGLTEAFRLLP